MNQTEFPFTLPVGYKDDQGTLHISGVMRQATAADEILPLEDPKVQANPGYVTIIKLSRVIVKLGNIKHVTPNIIESLSASELAYLQAFYNKINGKANAQIKVSQATKGSQKWIQITVNQKTAIINKQIITSLSLPDKETIEWFSPLKSENFKEYKDEEFLVKLGINPEKVKLYDFWPKSGPRWDALAKSSSGKLFLVEAKSHITELISDFKGSNQISIDKINESLNETKKRFGVRESYDWTKTFYQYANRLAHVNWLSKNGFDVRLVSVYFLNDEEMDGPKSIDEWKGAIRLLHRCLGLKEHFLNKFVVDVFIDVSTLR